MGNAEVAQQPKESQLEEGTIPLKIYVIGESYEGKACLARTSESENKSLPLGVSRHARRLKVRNIDVRLRIYTVLRPETSRRGIVLHYLHSVDSAILLYDVARLSSYHQLPILLKRVRNISPEAIIFIIGARCDSTSKREVSFATGQEFASSENLDFFECNALTNENVNEIFEQITIRLLQKKGLIPPDEKEILIEGKYLERKEEKEKFNASITEEESYGCASRKDPCNDFQKSFQDNGSGNVEQGLGTLKSITPSAESVNSDPGQEGCQMLTNNDPHASSQSDITKSLELNETCLSSDDQKDVKLRTVKPVLSEEEMFLQGKCPARNT